MSRSCPEHSGIRFSALPRFNMENGSLAVGTSVRKRASGLGLAFWSRTRLDQAKSVELTAFACALPLLIWATWATKCRWPQFGQTAESAFGAIRSLKIIPGFGRGFDPLPYRKSSKNGPLLRPVPQRPQRILAVILTTAGRRSGQLRRKSCVPPFDS